jgi:hemerythrin-like domain-containing protein
MMPMRKRANASTGTGHLDERDGRRAAATQLRIAAEAADDAAIRIIRDEHLSIASVLYSLRHAVRRIVDGAATADFMLLGAILHYIEQFPERLHHPKEDAWLFAALDRRCPEARKLIRDLQAEHILGDRLIGELRDALQRYSRDGEQALAEFAQRVEEYAEFHWQHMVREEEVLIPMARRHLAAEDWAAIGAAFRANDNPLQGIRPKEQMELLFRKILSLAAGDSRIAAGVVRT